VVPPRARLSDPGLAAVVVSAPPTQPRTRTPVRLAPQPEVPAPVTRYAMTAATVPGLDQVPTCHRRLREWVREVAELTRPDQVVWCDGSSVEWQRLTRQLVAAGTFVRLTEDAKPKS
jgi:Phosphoenolpyruvate carboxykinase N-terminal domain